MAIKPDVALETSDITLEKQVREVNLALTVTDRHGHFVNKLTPSDLLILDNDQRAEQITYFESRSNLPLQIALVIDTSESVAYCFNSERKTGARFLKRNLHSDRDTALIMTFSEGVGIAQQPSTDAGLLERSLKHIQAGGETAIYDAVSAASQELGKTKSPQPSRRVIILITDGEDNKSHTSLMQAAEMALRNETAVYVISNNTTGYENDGDKAMRQLSSATGEIS
jgi:Ca-activated chloride channel homolog